jgi:hypothetical protein
MAMRLHGVLGRGIVIAIVTPGCVGSLANGSSAFELDGAKAAGLGSGCNLAAGDMSVIAMGGDVSMIYTRLAVRLPASASDTSLSAIESCSVRIPATLRAGLYPHQISHLLRYAVDKSAGASGEIAATTGFADFPTARYSIDVPPGARTDPSVSASWTTPFLLASACSAADVSGLFRADVAITGTRTSASEGLVLGAMDASHDLRYDLTISTTACSP